MFQLNVNFEILADGVLVTYKSNKKEIVQIEGEGWNLDRLSDFRASRAQNEWLRQSFRVLTVWNSRELMFEVAKCWKRGHGHEKIKGRGG